MRAFAYERPTDLASAVALLAEHGPEARLLAGGTDLIIRLRDGTIRPRLVVDVKGVAELDGDIREHDGELIIGARAVMTDIAADERIRRDYRRSPRRRRSSGRCRSGTAPRWPATSATPRRRRTRCRRCWSYGAVVVVPARPGRRRDPDRRGLRPSGVTTLARGELVTAIELPRPATPRGSVHVRRTRRRGHDLASVTLACAVPPMGSTRLAYGSLGPRPLLVVRRDRPAGRSRGARRRPSWSASTTLFVDASPSPRSMRASPEYRLAMLHVLGLRAVATAIERLGHGGDGS